MTSIQAVLQIRHSALESSHGELLGQVSLTDRERLAIVLQAASLLSHLEAAGWSLECGWEGSRIDRQGVLRGTPVSVGPDPEPAQASLLSLMETLFGARDRIPGKGVANRLAVRFLQRWRRRLSPLPASRIVSELLDEAEFLWQPAFGSARRALIAEMSWSGGTRVTVAGRGAFENQLLSSATDYTELTEAVAGDRARAIWAGRSEGQSKRALQTVDGVTVIGLETAPCQVPDIGLEERRAMSRQEAAGLWTQIAYLQLGQGRLSAAAKAANHAQRLAEGVDQRIADHALMAHLESCLRQGRVVEVDDVLDSPTSSPESRSTGMRARLVELRARRYLVRGQPAPAYRELRSLLDRFDPSLEERYQVWRALAARALGWLGDGAAARELLEGMPVGELDGLDAEERPATWALAGDWARARESASSDGSGILWRLALAGDELPESAWRSLSEIEPYRAARMVFDFQLLMPGRAQSRWLERAGNQLRAVGADSFAERLDRGREGSWKALERYLKRPVIDNRDLGRLFEVAGYFDVHLEWQSQLENEVLVPGRGGVEKLTVDRSEGRLQLSAGRIDPALKALFALAARDFHPSTHDRRPRSSRVKGILGRSDALQQSLDRLERLAVTDLAVLIQGETGTGKELAARQLHQLSSRSSQRLVALNCAAVSESLLLSDLFGHVRGAFTGADRNRAGVFETASGGSVLLDEIGDLPWAAQGKLLRVLQEGEVRRVGESLPRAVDVRVLAATHRDLGSMVEKGEFRRDLFYRLKVSSLTLPPLRQRGGDVLLLAEYFVSRAGCRLTPRASQRLLGYHWPGNVRELRNVLQVAAALSRNGVVDLSSLELPQERTDKRLGYHAQVEELRCRLVREALMASSGHRARAARRLGVSRQALSYLVKRFDLAET